VSQFCARYCCWFLCRCYFNPVVPFFFATFFVKWRCSVYRPGTSKSSAVAVDGAKEQLRRAEATSSTRRPCGHPHFTDLLPVLRPVEHVWQDGAPLQPSDLRLQAASRCLIIGSPFGKVSPGRQFTGKNPPRPAAVQAGKIFSGKLSAGGNFSGGRGRSYNGETFNGACDVLIKGDISNPWLSLPGGFFMGRHFNVTPASEPCWSSCCCCCCWVGLRCGVDVTFRSMTRAREYPPAISPKSSPFSQSPQVQWVRRNKTFVKFRIDWESEALE